MDDWASTEEQVNVFLKDPKVESQSKAIYVL